MVACLLFAGQLISQTSRAPTGALADVVYLGAFPTAVAFTTWAYALARTSAGKMGATVYATPALTVLMSGLILGEVPRWPALVGGVVCLAGVAITRSRSRRNTPLEADEGSSSATQTSA